MPLTLIPKLSLAVTTLLVALSAVADPVPAGTDDEIRARLARFGSLCRAGESCGGTGTVADTGGAEGGATAGATRSGEDVYNQFCFACHATGASEAPIFGDAEAWAPRIAKGIDELMVSTLNGTGLMPPRGTCMACSDEELKATVEYMTSQAQ
ncbi:MAG: c-type cytochrome [Gammaproteobacteria bacterium]